MKGSVAVGWMLFAAWSVWLLALQGRLAARAWSAWLPDLGLALFLSLAPFLRRQDILPAALLAALARIALSIDAPLAILVGFVAAAVAVTGARGMVALEGLVVRSVLAALVAGLFVAWLAFAHALREPALAGLDPLLVAVPWKSALATGVTAGLFGPLLARLPGLTPLRKRRSWPTVVSFI